ncbi:MAG: DNA alkylation repair protein [Candidatus Magasanikbacteria bacterium CG10_big_fil_rev_8_21_14_0_10_40_10]|uniref:DNA alkylation repair protein n=1 Tax=Candidatus Magasanikbacteria bacterium CG10_big_fil_rev_8_21_14_0_10_40_10 TaxID=1974648 RepID=A0A2M6W4E1_9BACT|nr:MAG: DNA alkylation repair protein [Candidatus Magasanikbacteria bacterium CG10_big_fil_rev_8_21_14_0_10_40_10]
MIHQVQSDLKKLSDSSRIVGAQRFFKTGKGQYGEGDKFIGVIVPNQRKIAAKYADLSSADLQKLLNSNIHEYRLTAIFILVNQYQQAKRDMVRRKKLVGFYLKNTKNINNWDLVDSSAQHILGDYLRDKTDRKILYRLAKSKNLWEKRISIIATLALIRLNQFDDTVALAEILLKDNHDLTHKAVGWMLREVGNRDQARLKKFLNQHIRQMPRVMLRYAIEKLAEKTRKYYLDLK